MAIVHFDFRRAGSVSATGQGNISFPSGTEKVLSARLNELANQLSSEIKEHRITRVAVLPLVDVSQAMSTPLGSYLTGRITNELYKTGSVRVIERSQLDTVIKELSLTMSGMFDEASVKNIGRILAVDAVIMGTYAEIGAHTLELNTRIVNVETAELLGVSSVQIPKVAAQQLVP
jgi:TolB-like protein